MRKPGTRCYHSIMKPLILAIFCFFCLATPASAQFLGGASGELTFLRGPEYPENPEDSRTALITGGYFGASGFEVRSGVILAEGASQGFLVDLGLRITPKWFGQPEYLFNLVSPYGVISGSASFPWSVGWSARAGLGFAILRYASVNAEIGYRSHRLSENALLEGVTVGVHASYPF